MARFALSEGALAVLAQVKSGLQLEKRGEIVHFDCDQAEALETLEARDYATWAGRRLAFVLKGNCPNAEAELVVAELWAKKKLQRGYLVKSGFIEHAYQAALRFARAR